MSTAPEGDTTYEAQHELWELRKDWWWLLILGIAMIIMGIAALSSAIYMAFTTIVMVTLFGILLIVGGVAELVSSFWTGHWQGAMLHVLIGILYVVSGFIIVDNPGEAALALTFMIGAFFIVGGLFRIIAALQLRFHNWGWPLLNGFVTLLLGVLIIKQWPASSLWIIGLFVGIELIFNGWSWVMLALDVRAIPEEEEEAA